MTTTPAPLTVIDVRDNTWTPYVQAGTYDRLIKWAEQHGINPEVVFRVEVYLLDAPFARVHELALDADGRRYFDGDDYALREPYTVPLTSLPPSAEEESRD